MSKTSAESANAKGPVRKATQARQEEKVRILAARLRLTTDRKLDKSTPEWVQQLANKSL